MEMNAFSYYHFIVMNIIINFSHKVSFGCKNIRKLLGSNLEKEMAELLHFIILLLTLLTNVLLFDTHHQNSQVIFGHLQA